MNELPGASFLESRPSDVTEETWIMVVWLERYVHIDQAELSLSQKEALSRYRQKRGREILKEWLE